MVYKTILLSLITFALYGQIMLSPNRAEIIDPPAAGGGGSIDDAVPTVASTTAEDPWLDDTWVTPENIYGAGEASITSNTYDNGDQSYILKGYTFDFSAIPAGATIVGVVCTINARSSTSSHQFDLIQLLSDVRAKGGTNLALTPVTIASAVGADYVFGAADNLWGNALTETWDKDADFGVAIGVLSATNNSDVFIDYVLLSIYYTE